MIRVDVPVVKTLIKEDDELLKLLLLSINFPKLKKSDFSECIWIMLLLKNRNFSICSSSMLNFGSILVYSVVFLASPGFLVLNLCSIYMAGNFCTEDPSRP